MKSLSRFAVCLFAIGSFVACTSSGEGGAGGEDEPGGVTAVNLETGETSQFDDAEDVPAGWVVCEGACPAPLPCNGIGEGACLLRDDCAPLYDDAGSFDGCGDGGATCDADACGPAPGMPAVECPDGSIGGNTGRCLAAPDGTCGWEIRECPSDTCPDEACGPMPGMPAEICDDGSIGGNTGRCLADADGTCGWEIRACPDDDCTAEECGPQPPGLPCSDGSGTVGPCARGEDGVCGWEIRTCPEETCTEEECGPMPGLPSYMCEDGSTGGNTGRCIRYDGGVCGWENRECPEDAG